MAEKSYQAGVKEYRDKYWTPDYVPLDTDLLACFKVTGQPEVPREEVAAAVAAESSTGTWSTVWSELLTDLEYYKGRATASKTYRVTANLSMHSSHTRSTCSKKVLSLTY